MQKFDQEECLPGVNTLPKVSFSLPGVNEAPFLSWKQHNTVNYSIMLLLAQHNTVKYSTLWLKMPYFFIRRKQHNIGKYSISCWKNKGNAWNAKKRENESAKREPKAINQK